MTKAEALRLAQVHATLRALGFDDGEIDALFRIERTLQRWGEQECGGEGGCIERDEATGKPYWHSSITGKRWPISDREAGALRRLGKIMARHAPLTAYHQSDCRGCGLYIIRPGDVPEGGDVGGYYTRGIAVCC